MGSSPLQLHGLTKMFGRVAAVNRVSVRIESGERHAIVGPNGAGKTTLFNLVSGIHRPTSGRVGLFGQDVSRMAVHRRAAMGLARTFQITNLFESLTVLDNVLLAAQARERCRFHFHKPLSRYSGLKERVEVILEQWGLTAKRDLVVSSLSYGDQRQLEVIMALANDPRLLLLDEPTAGLSPSETGEMTRFLCRLDEAITILLIEHDMDVVFSVADRVTVMHYGTVIADGPADEIREDPEVTAIYLGEGLNRHVDGR
ncbi:ABC transporter ATP-binding protein [Thermodesulfobacteriota bacterium]